MCAGAIGYLPDMSSSALVLHCTLKPSPAESSPEPIGTQIRGLGTQDVTGVILRVELGVRFGFSAGEGNGDGWPDTHARMFASDKVVLATPIGMGQPSPVCTMVPERAHHAPAGQGQSLALRGPQVRQQ